MAYGEVLDRGTRADGVAEGGIMESKVSIRSPRLDLLLRTALDYLLVNLIQANHF